MTDHYFFEGSWAIPQKYPYTAKTAKKIHIMKATGKRNGKRFLTQVLCFLKKSFCTSYSSPKRSCTTQ